MKNTAKTPEAPIQIKDLKKAAFREKAVAQIKQSLREIKCGVFMF